MATLDGIQLKTYEINVECPPEPFGIGKSFTREPLGAWSGKVEFKRSRKTIPINKRIEIKTEKVKGNVYITEPVLNDNNKIIGVKFKGDGALYNIT